jgi:hypothetical protein
MPCSRSAIDRAQTQGDAHAQGALSGRCGSGCSRHRHDAGRGAARRSRRTSQLILRKVRRRFFWMSTCIFSRAFCARSLDRSICSAVTGLAPGAVSLPAADAFPLLRSVCSTSPSSLAATTMPTAWACLTACSLNSAVYSCFGIFCLTVTLTSCARSSTSLAARRSRNRSQTACGGRFPIKK